MSLFKGDRRHQTDLFIALSHIRQSTIKTSHLAKNPLGYRRISSKFKTLSFVWQTNQFHPFSWKLRNWQAIFTCSISNVNPASTPPTFCSSRSCHLPTRFPFASGEATSIETTRQFWFNPILLLRAWEELHWIGFPAERHYETTSIPIFLVVIDSGGDKSQPCVPIFRSLLPSLWIQTLLSDPRTHQSLQITTCIIEVVILKSLQGERSNEFATGGVPCIKADHF
jgi:hypothetical protein